MPSGKSSKEEKTSSPLDVNLKLTPTEWILYWKTKYEAAHVAHVEQKRAAKQILDQRDAAVRMLNELPKEKIINLQTQADKTAKKGGKPFESGALFQALGHIHQKRQAKTVKKVAKAPASRKKKQTRK